jgi:hypothetical protein
MPLISRKNEILKIQKEAKYQKRLKSILANGKCHLGVAIMSFLPMVASQLITMDPNLMEECG